MKKNEKETKIKSNVKVKDTVNIEVNKTKKKKVLENVPEEYKNDNLNILME